MDFEGKYMEGLVYRAGSEAVISAIEHIFFVVSGFRCRISAPPLV